MTQDILREKIPVAHLSEHYIKEYRSRLLFSAACNMFLGATNFVQGLACVIVGSVVPNLFVVASTVGAVEVIMTAIHFSRGLKDIGKREELDRELKNIGDVNIRDIPGFDYKDDEAKFELAVSSLVGVLYKKSKLKEGDNEFTSLARSESYFTNFISEACRQKLAKEGNFVNSVIEDMNKVRENDTGNLVRLIFNTVVSAASASIAVEFLKLATFPLYASVNFAFGIFCAMSAIKTAYGAYKAYKEVNKTYEYKSGGTLGEELMGKIDKILDQRVKDLEIPKSNDAGLRTQVRGKFTAMLETRGNGVEGLSPHLFPVF